MAMRTKTKSKLSTRTKTFVGAATLATVGLGGYGYGFALLPTANAPKSATVISSKTALPIVKQRTLASSKLANGNRELISFQVGAGSNAAIAFKQIVFTFKKTKGLQLSKFRVRKGNTDLPLGDYDIWIGKNSNLKTGTLFSTATDGFFTVSFKNPQSVMPWADSIYTLHATVTGTKKGQSLTLTTSASDIRFDNFSQTLKP